MFRLAPDISLSCMVANNPFAIRIKEPARIKQKYPLVLYGIWLQRNIYIIYKYIYSFVTWAGLANFTVCGDKKKTFVLIILYTSPALSGFSNYPNAIKHQWGRNKKIRRESEEHYLYYQYITKEQKLKRGKGQLEKSFDILCQYKY